MTIKARARAKLVAARALLAKRGGWGKGSYGGTHTNFKFCAIGALLEATAAGSLLDPGYTKALDALTKSLPSGWSSVTEYNDSRRRKMDVLDLYDRAIELVG